jgi:hypothetical protein
MSSTPVTVALAIDAVVVNTNTNTNTKKVKKVRVQALEAATAVESGSESGSAPADADPDPAIAPATTIAPADAAPAVLEKKKRAVKKAQEKKVVAVTEVVQMVAEMKTAFTDVTEAVTQAGPEEELVLDTYIESPLDIGDFEPLVELDLGDLGDLGDSVVDFEALRLDGDDTPCCNPIPEPIQDDEPVAEVAVDVATVTAVALIRPVRPVFRFEFSPECFELLSGFARENLGVPRKEYKAKWEQFATDHAEFIAQESARLADAGYDGDVLIKMFKTVKYYLTKRVKAATTASAVVEQVDQVAETTNVNDEGDVDDDATVDADVDTDTIPVQTQTQTRRRHYTTLDRAVLEAMDSHITSSISSNSKPATCYASFCDQFRNSIETEIARLVRFDGLVVRDAFTFTEKTAEEKLKKTYKNRMFLHIRNM